ncbi:conserved hypothetical protein, partial [Ricinus communis]
RHRLEIVLARCPAHHRQRRHVIAAARQGHHLAHRLEHREHPQRHHHGQHGGHHHIQLFCDLQIPEP